MSGNLKVWSKFSVKNKQGAVLNLRIVDMPKTLHEKVINLYIKYFVHMEATLKAAGIPKSLEALEEVCEYLLELKDDAVFHFVICCLDNGDDHIDEVFGASIMALITKENPEPERDHKTPEVKKLFEIIHDLSTYYDEVKAFNLDRCFSDRGLFVCPDYTGLGIARELLKVRRLICKEYGIPVNGAWMTSYGTQIAAQRDGWETVCEIQCEELAKKHGVTYEKEPPTTKFMIARIN